LEVQKEIQISITINRQLERALGISIVTGSNDDTGVVITKLLPNGLAAKSGMCVGDKILAVSLNKIIFNE
jgi:S1-C subfamily serine protease